MDYLDLNLKEEKFFDYLRNNSKGNLNEICSHKDKNTFIHKYDIHTTFDLLGKCMLLYEKDDIQNFRLKLVTNFYDIEDKNNIFYYLTEKISILFPGFYEEKENLIFKRENITISNNLLAEFLRNQQYEDLKSVPYISKKYEKILKQNNIDNTFLLIAKYLELNSDSQKMFCYLKDLGIHNNLNNIICCIGEKCNLILPGNY